MKTFKNGCKPQKSEKSHFLLHNVLTSTNQDSACIYLLANIFICWGGDAFFVVSNCSSRLYFQLFAGLLNNVWLDHVYIDDICRSDIFKLRQLPIVFSRSSNSQFGGSRKKCLNFVAVCRHIFFEFFIDIRLIFRLTFLTWYTLKLESFQA